MLLLFRLKGLLLKYIGHLSLILFLPGFKIERHYQAQHRSSFIIRTEKSKKILHSVRKVGGKVWVDGAMSGASLRKF